MNIVSVLQEEHAVLRDLLEQAKADFGKFDRFKVHLVVHQRNEEASFLEVLEKKAPAQPRALEAMEEHRVLDWLLDNLRDFPKDHERWRAKLEVLSDLCTRHLDEEERDVFPLARQHLTSCEMDSMGEQYRRHQEAQLHVL